MQKKEILCNGLSTGTCGYYSIDEFEKFTHLSANWNVVGNIHRLHYSKRELQEIWR